MSSSPAKQARYVKKEGFLCSQGNHVLYCPNLSSADKTKPFYIQCTRHRITFKIDLSSKEAVDFIADFPNGCKESSVRVKNDGEKRSRIKVV